MILRNLGILLLSLASVSCGQEKSQPSNHQLEVAEAYMRAINNPSVVELKQSNSGYTRLLKERGQYIVEVVIQGDSQVDLEELRQDIERDISCIDGACRISFK